MYLCIVVEQASQTFSQVVLHGYFVSTSISCKALLISAEAISPSLSSRGSGSVAGRKFFTSSSFNDGQGGFTRGISPTQGRAASSSLASNQGGSPDAGSATQDTLGGRPAGSRTLPEEDSYLQSTQASQGSLDTNQDLAIGSARSISSQSELTQEATGVSYTKPLSDVVPDSAAELAQPVGSTAGTTAGTSAISSLPPSAGWGAAPSEPSPTPVHTPAPTPAATQQPAETPASDPYQHGSLGFAETVPDQSPSTPHGTCRSHSPITHESELAHSLPDGHRQESIPDEMAQDRSSEHKPAAASVPSQDAFTERSFGPATDGAASQSVVEAPGHVEEQEPQMQQADVGQTAQDGFAAQAFEQPKQRAQRDQIEEPVYQAQGTESAPTLQHGFDKGSVQEPAQLEQVAEPMYTAQGAGAVSTKQDRQPGFSDDVFAQFSPLTSRSNQSQSANPFAPATAASPVAQEPVLESAQPAEPSMKVWQVCPMV